MYQPTQVRADADCHRHQHQADGAAQPSVTALTEKRGNVGARVCLSIKCTRNVRFSGVRIQGWIGASVRS